MITMEKLTLYILDQRKRYWPVRDAQAATFANNENGFSVCNWQLPRNFGFAYDDIGLNNQVFWLSASNDVAWHGRLESIEPKLENGRGVIACSASGYWSSAFDLPYRGILGTSATPEALITALLGATYLPQLSSAATGLLVTGLTARRYETPDGGSQDVFPGDAILAICKWGTSTTGQRVVPAVFENRLLTTRALPATPTARYQVQRKNIGNLPLKRLLSSVFNRVTVRYKDGNGALQRATVNDVASQAALGVDFTGGGTLTNLVREQIKDITGLNATGNTEATAYANASLYTTRRVRNESQQLTILRDYTIFDLNEGQQIPNWKVKAGYWLQIPDLFPSAIETGSGTDAGDAALSNLFYITNCQYEVATGQLQITPESSSRIEDLIAGSNS